MAWLCKRYMCIERVNILSTNNFYNIFLIILFFKNIILDIEFSYGMVMQKVYVHRKGKYSLYKQLLKLIY